MACGKNAFVLKTDAQPLDRYITSTDINYVMNELQIHTRLHRILRNIFVELKKKKKTDKKTHLYYM